MPEDYIIFLAKKSGGKKGELLKSFAKFHRLKGGGKEVVGAVFSAASAMKEIHLTYAFLMLAYDGPSNPKSKVATFVKPADICAWAKRTNGDDDQVQKREKAEEWLQAFKGIFRNGPYGNTMTRLESRFHIDVLLVCLGDTKIDAYVKGLQSIVSNAKKAAANAAKAQASASCLAVVAASPKSNKAAASTEGPDSPSKSGEAAATSSAYILSCAAALAECDPPRKSIDAAAYHFLDAFTKAFPEASAKAREWESFVVSKGGSRAEAAKGQDGNAINQMSHDEVTMAEISPEGLVQDRATTYVLMLHEPFDAFAF